MKRTLISALLLLAAVTLGAQNEPVRFAFLSDIHICTDSPRIDNLNKCIDDINADESIQFSIFGGDITEFGADHEIALAKSILDRLKKPYYIVAGNHDAKWSESGCNTFARIFGYEHFAFEAGGVKFIGCNSGPNMRMAPALMPHESLVWLDSIAKATPHEQPVIFVNHYPQDSSMLNYFQVMNTLKQCNIQLLLGGHWHSNTILNYEGVPGILGRSPDRGKEIGYNVMTIQEGKFEAVERILIDKEGREAPEYRKPWYTMQFSGKPLYAPDNFDKSANPYGLPEAFPWLKFDINDEYPQIRSIWSRQDESDIGGGAAYAGKYVVYANTQGVIKAIDSRDGSLRWSYATEGKVFSTPAIARRRVIVGSSDGYIYCLNLRNGRLRWKYKCEKSVLASPAILGKIAYVGSSDGVFRALKIRNGKLVWKYEGVKGFVECRPFVDRTQVVFGDWANTLYSLDTKSGELQWKWNTKGSRMFSPAAVYPVKSNGKIFVVTPERKSYAIDAATGEQLWEGRGGRESIALSADGKKVYVKTMWSTLQAYSTESEGCELLWEVNDGTGYEIAPTPSLSVIKRESDGTLMELIMLPTDKGNIFCFDGSDGSQIWRHKISVALINSIVPLENDRLLISTMDGVVTILQY